MKSKEVTFKVLGNEDSFQIVFSLDGKEVNAGIFMSNQLMSKSDNDVWKQVFDNIMNKIAL